MADQKQETSEVPPNEQKDENTQIVPNEQQNENQQPDNQTGQNQLPLTNEERAQSQGSNGSASQKKTRKQIVKEAMLQMRKEKREIDEKTGLALLSRDKNITSIRRKTTQTTQASENDQRESIQDEPIHPVPTNVETNNNQPINPKQEDQNIQVIPHQPQSPKQEETNQQQNIQPQSQDVIPIKTPNDNNIPINTDTPIINNQEIGTQNEPTPTKQSYCSRFGDNMKILLKILFCMCFRYYFLMFLQFRKREKVKPKWYNCTIYIHIGIFYVWFSLMGVIVQIFFFIPNFIYFFPGMFLIETTKNYYECLKRRFEASFEEDGYMEYVFFWTGGYAFQSFMMYIYNLDYPDGCCKCCCQCFIANTCINCYMIFVGIFHQCIFLVGNVIFIWLFFVPSLMTSCIGVKRWKELLYAIVRKLETYFENLFYAIVGSCYMFCDDFFEAKEVDHYIVETYGDDDFHNQVSSSHQCYDCIWNYVCYPLILILFSVFFQGIILVLFAIAIVFEIFHPPLFAKIFVTDWPADCYSVISRTFRECCHQQETTVIHKGYSA